MGKEGGFRTYKRVGKQIWERIRNGNKKTRGSRTKMADKVEPKSERI